MNHCYCSITNSLFELHTIIYKCNCNHKPAILFFRHWRLKLIAIRLILFKQLSWKLKQTLSRVFQVPRLNCWCNFFIYFILLYFSYIYIYILESKDESQTNVIEKFTFKLNQMVLELEFEPCDLAFNYSLISLIFTKCSCNDLFSFILIENNTFFQEEGFTFVCDFMQVFQVPLNGCDIIYITITLPF